MSGVVIDQVRVSEDLLRKREWKYSDFAARLLGSPRLSDAIMKQKRESQRGFSAQLCQVRDSDADIVVVQTNESHE